MAKNKKRKPHKTRPATVVRDIPSILYRKITCKYLANMDTFQVYVDMIMNGTVLHLLGNIDPNSSYTEGIRIFTKTPQPWMTCTELQVSKRHAPGLFSVLTAYSHTIGDLLDEGCSEDELMEGVVYKDDRLFTDLECVQLFRHKKKFERLQCPKCKSLQIGCTFKYPGVFTINQFGDKLNVPEPVPSGKFWRCLDCNAVVKEVEDGEW